MKPHAKQFSLPLLKKEQIARDTYSFYFDRTQTAFDFLAGQYIRMTVPHTEPDDRGTSRFFTIASSPHEKNHLMITTKLFRSSFKETLHTLLLGTHVDFFGPMGTFFLDETDLTPRVFVSGGVGVTPFHSMIQYVVSKELSIPITLIVSFRKEDEIIFYNELHALTKKQKNLHIIYTTEKISQTFLEKHISPLQENTYAIVGSPTFVAVTKELISSLAVLEDKIFIEDFTGY